ncbi:MAG: hypothetical protein KBT04_05355, partial [Bacteroidales bacterium]|nr:hypothetical protein [Candidatus Colimorpha onthohippi]
YLALGSYFKFYFKRDIFPNFNLYMKLELSYDYNKVRRVDWSLDPEYVTTEERTWRSIFHHTDINLECSINYKLSKWLAISGTLNMKYDTDYANVGSFGHWQMYQLAGLRFFYKSERKR